MRAVLVCLLLTLPLTAQAIVSKIDPSQNSGNILISAEESYNVFESYTRGEINSTTVSTFLLTLCQRNEPTCTLSAQDNTDVTNILALIDAVPATNFNVPANNATMTAVIQAARKIDVCMKYRRLAIGLQTGLVPDAATFRSRLGIAAP